MEKDSWPTNGFSSAGTSKTDIRRLIAEGKLENARQAALAYAEYCGLADIANALVVMGSQSSQNKEQWNSGLISYEDFSRSHARLSHALTQWIDRLPDVPKLATRRGRLLRESTFKARIFYGLCIIKVIVLLRLAYNWSTGGFNDDQFYGSVSLLAPTLAVYVWVMLNDYLRQHRRDISVPRYLSGPLVNFSFIVLPLYFALLILFVEMKAAGLFTYLEMAIFLALTESVIGGYIGQIVFSFFRPYDA